jgi:hypothetical protein
MKIKIIQTIIFLSILYLQTISAQNVFGPDTADAKRVTEWSVTA